MAGKDRKKQLARQRYQRQQQRQQAEAARTRRLKIIGSVAGVVVIAGGGTATAMAVGMDEESGKCSYNPSQAAGAPKNLGRPPKKPANEGMVQATAKTSEGDVVMQLDGSKAPCTVNSFAFLAQKNFFDNTSCHRLTTGGLNVLQCGDPTGSGSGGPGYEFPDENTAGAKYPKGTLAMANSGPDTNGSQFFMVYADSQLQPNYTVFGKITKGMDVLEKIAKAGSNPKGDGAPKKKVTVQDVAIAGK